MSVRQSIRQFAAYYRKSARLAVFIILLASFAIPSVLASGPGSLNLSPSINLNAVSPFGCGVPLFPSHGYYQASGGVGITGTYSGNVYLTGSITIYGHDKATDKPETETLSLTQADFSPNPMNFPSQSQSGVKNPQVNSNFCEPVVDGYWSWVAASNQPGCTGGGCVLANSSVTVTVTGGTTQMFQLVMEMPLFNETTLGTTVHCAPTTAPCGLPLQGFYDFIFIVAIILAGGGLLITLANKQYHRRREEERRARLRDSRPLHRPLPGDLQQHRPAHQLPRHDDTRRSGIAVHRLHPLGQPGLGEAALLGAGRRDMGHARLADNDPGRCDQ